MKICIVTEYVRRFPWSAGRWAADLGHALAARGHRVTVACDGVEDPTLFSGVDLLVRRPGRTWRGSDPRGFQTWGLGESAGHDATLSLTPLVPGDLWAPISHRAGGLVRHLVRSHSPVSAFMELAARPWLPAAMLAEARAETMAARGGRTLIARIGRVSCRGSVVPLGYASRLKPLTDAEHRAARGAVRGLLGVSAERALVLISAVHPYRPGLDRFLRGFVRAREELGDHAPLLLVMGRRTVPVHAAARRAGASRFVRFLGGTARPELAFAAADLAAAPWSALGERGTGRFVADALRLSVPVLASGAATGSELVRPEHFGTPELGTVVDGNREEEWASAIVQQLSIERWAYARRAARDAGAVLGMDGMATRVERLLSQGTG